jgi:hypothetical protein
LLLEPPGKTLPEIHQGLSQIRRGALDRVHPGLAYPTFLRVDAGEFEKAVVGISKFASVLSLGDDGGETWLPLWTYSAETMGQIRCTARRSGTDLDQRYAVHVLREREHP